VIIGVEPVIGLHRDDFAAEAPRIAQQSAGLAAVGLGGVAGGDGDSGLRGRLHDNDGLAAQGRGFSPLARGEEGQMDRARSGLADMVPRTVNHNGSVVLGPTEDNRYFVVTMEARREAVDEITNTALPVACRHDGAEPRALLYPYRANHWTAAIAFANSPCSRRCSSALSFSGSRTTTNLLSVPVNRYGI
jgi:hypothetical protein